MKEALKWYIGLELFIETLLDGLSKRLKNAERELLRVIMSEFLPILNLTNGKLSTTARNLARLNMINDIMDRFSGDNEFVLKFANELLEVAGKNAEYYLISGFDKTKIESIASDLNIIRAKIGIDASGKIIEDGYLYRLGKSDDVRQRIRDYVIKSLASRILPQDMSAGLANLIVGTDEVDGALTQYWRQYAYDTYNNVREIKNLHYANELNLNYFMYVGGLIDSSRLFCIKRNGKVFSRDESQKWKDDPDLIDKSTKDQYQPFIERGRYNCRHFIAWISNEEAFRQRPELKN